MILTVDAGNSNIVCVVYDDTQSIIDKKRIETTKNLDEAYAFYVDTFRTINQSIDTVVVACVVPKIADILLQALEDVFQTEPYNVTQLTVPSFKNRLDNPLEIGADFIATAVGALNRFTTPLIIVDIGSATKITVVNKDQSFKGGVIIPGLGVSMQSMVEKIEHLPTVSFEFPPQVIGHDTVSAIQSGIMNATYYQIIGLTQAMQKEMNQPCTCVLTGGYSTLFKSKLSDFEWIDNLANEGLYHLVKEGRILCD